MRSLERTIFAQTLTFNNSPGAAPYVMWTNPAAGVYNLYIDPAYEMQSFDAMASNTTSSQAIGGTVLLRGATTVQVQFLSAGGATGSFGGFALLVLRKRVA